MKRTSIRRLTWQEVQARGPECSVRGCKRPPEDDLPVCARHAPAHLFNLSKLGQVGEWPAPPPERQAVKRKPTLNRQSKWRGQCLAVREYRCIAAELGDCSSTTEFECDHVQGRSQGGPYVVENGVFVCHEHHRQKTDCELRYRRKWLGEDQIAWLASVQWVAWDRNGYPYGKGWRHFEPIETRQP